MKNTLIPLDMIFAEIQASPRYRAAFPDIEAKFTETLARLETEPASVVISHPATGEDATPPDFEVVASAPARLLSITDVNANPIAGGDLSCREVEPAP